MGLLDLDSIRNSDDLPTEDVPCPEWGGDVRLRVLTGEEIENYERMVVEKDGVTPNRNAKDIMLTLVIMSAIKEDGTPLFTRDHLGWLRKKSSKVIRRLFGRAMAINGRTDEAVGELGKNSETTLDEEPGSV